MTPPPASGPLGPVTTPPISSLSIATAVWALACTGASHAARPMAAAVLKKNCFFCMSGSSVSPVAPWPAAGGAERGRHIGMQSPRNPSTSGPFSRGSRPFPADLPPLAERPEQPRDPAAVVVAHPRQPVRADQALDIEATGAAARHQHLGAEIVVGERLSGDPADHLEVAGDLPRDRGDPDGVLPRCFGI